MTKSEGDSEQRKETAALGDRHPELSIPFFVFMGLISLLIATTGIRGFAFCNPDAGGLYLLYGPGVTDAYRLLSEWRRCSLVPANPEVGLKRTQINSVEFHDVGAMQYRRKVLTVSLVDGRKVALRDLNDGPISTTSPSWVETAEADLNQRIPASR